MPNVETVLLNHPHTLLKVLKLLYKSLVYLAQVLRFNAEPTGLGLKLNDELFATHLKFVFVGFFLQRFHFTVDPIHVTTIGIHEFFLVLMNYFEGFPFVLLDGLIEFDKSLLKLLFSRDGAETAWRSTRLKRLCSESCR